MDPLVAVGVYGEHHRSSGGYLMLMTWFQLEK